MKYYHLDDIRPAISVIQLDAFRAGMMLAAELVDYQTQVAVAYKDPRACAKQAQERILSTAQSLTRIPE